MKAERLFRTLRFLTVFLAGAFLLGCGEKDPVGPEPPGPEPQVEEGVVVHNFSNDGNSKAEVLSIDYLEGEKVLLTINVPKNELPKVNEYLVSAPTKLAPYGYLLKVTKVTEESGTRGIGDTIEELKAKVEAVFATINEVIRNININKVFYIPLPDVSFEDFKPIFEGLKFTMNTWTEDDPVILEHGMSVDGNGDLEYIAGMVSEDNGEGKHKGNKVSLTFDSFQIDGITIKPAFSFVQKGLYLSLEVIEGTFQKIGFDYEANLSCSLEVTDSFKGKLIDKKILLGSLIQNYIIPAGEVPVVVTLVVPLIFEIKLDGSVGFSFKPLDVDYDIGVGTYYDFPRASFFPYGNHDAIFDVTDNTSQKEYVGIGNLQSDLTMKGHLSFDLSAGVSVGLYGCNVIDRKAGWMLDDKGRTKVEKELMKAYKDIVEAEFVVDTKAEFSAKLGIGSIDEVAADMNIRDDCGFKWDLGAQLAASLKIPFFGNLTPTWDTPRLTFYDTADDIRCSHTLFFSDFSNLKVEEDPANQSNLIVSAIKSKPLFGYRAYQERSFGLYFVPSDLKNDAAGMSSPNWVQRDLSNNSDYVFGDRKWVEIYERIPKAQFEKDRYYDVYAYTEVDGPILGNIYLLRADKQFRLSETGGLSTVDVEDIPGENL